MSRRPYQNGFTLLELLVALSVFSLLLVTLSQGLRFGIQAWSVQSRETRRLAELDSVDRLLRNLLASIPVAANGSLSGSASKLTFLGSLPRAAPPGLQPESITLLVTRDNHLVLSWNPPIPGKAAATPPPVLTEILDNVSDIAFGYFREAGAAAQGKKATKSGWQSTWVGGGIPALVRIHIDFVDGDPRHWPDIVVAPMVQGTQGGS